MKDTKALFLDYVLGNIRPSSQEIAMMVRVLSLSDYVVDDTFVWRDDGPLDFEEYALFTGLIHNDVGTAHFVRSLKDIKESSPMPVYCFTSSLIKALSKTNIELTKNFLPSSGTYYFSMDGLCDYDGCPIVGTLLRIFDDKNGARIISIASITKEDTPAKYAFGYNIFEIKDDLSIEQAIIRNPRKVQKLVDGKIETITSKIFAVPEYTKALINGLIYARNQEYEVNLSDFETGSTKAIETRKKINTHLPHQRFGDDFVLPKNWHYNATVVSGFFRWQRCGEKLSRVKLIYIDPHIRTFGD